MLHSIVNMKDTEGAFRIDPEYYSPLNLNRMTKLKSLPEVILLRDAASLITDMGAFSLYKKEYLVDQGIPFLRVNNIEQNRLTLNGTIYITPEYHEKLKKSHVRYKDVLLTTKAIIGMSCTVPDSIGACNMSQNLVRIVIKEDIFNPYYVSTFLTSDYGLFQTNRLATGNVQLYLNFENIGEILIPKLSDRFESSIEKVIKHSESSISNAEMVYRQAEKVLLAELALANWQPKHQLSFVKNYSATDKTGRIDAEYFQPKYDEIVKAIKSYPGGWGTLGNIASVKKCVEVGSEAYMDEGDVPFVRVSNLSPFEITEEKYISNELYSELSQHQPKQGEILFSKDGTPGIAYHINEKSKKMIPSGGILRLKLKTKQINEDYLTLVLNSMIVQEQINRDVGGSIILHWRPEQVKDSLIPILPEDKQSQIQQQVTKSYNLRKQSKHLLECAKRAVEIAIEENEKTAMKWLETETGSIR